MHLSKGEVRFSIAASFFPFEMFMPHWMPFPCSHSHKVWHFSRFIGLQKRRKERMCSRYIKDCCEWCHCLVKHQLCGSGGFFSASSFIIIFWKSCSRNLVEHQILKLIIYLLKNCSCFCKIFNKFGEHCSNFIMASFD